MREVISRFYYFMPEGYDAPLGYLANIPNDNTWQKSWEAWFQQAMRRTLEVEEKAHGKDPKSEV